LAYTVRTVVEAIPSPDGGMVTIEAPKLAWDGLRLVCLACSMEVF
jgi:hypothetical protein